MLKTHFDNIEKVLPTLSKISSSAGHPINIGTPREAFIKTFLNDHISTRVSIGCGEIIDSKSAPNSKRSQIDIVLYKNEFPRLTFGGGITAFLAESVVCTIEVKSILTKRAVKRAIGVSHEIKKLQRNLITIEHFDWYRPRHILCYIVAYDGPKQMSTVGRWLSGEHSKQGIEYPEVPSNFEERMKITSPSLDAIFVLKKGHVTFINSPVTNFSDDDLANKPDTKWVCKTNESGNLLKLFMLLTMSINESFSLVFDPHTYLYKHYDEVINFTNSVIRK